MKVDIRLSFVKDTLKLPANVQKQIPAIISLLESCSKLSEIHSCKKLKGFKSAYRIRLGDYRIGFFFENNSVELVRILSRKDVYRFFP